LPATLTTTQVTDGLVQVLAKSAGLEGFNVIAVAKVDATHLTMKVNVPQGNPLDGTGYKLRTVTLTVAIS
jgi:hypothetical protein